MWLEIEYNDNLLHFIPLFVEIAAAAVVVVVFRLSLDILRSVRSFALIFAMLAVCDERWQGLR